MADKYIDHDETQIYGPHSSNRIRTRLVGLIPELDDALKYVANRIDTNTAAVKLAVKAARAKDAEGRKATTSKAPLLKEGRRLLGRFSKHLSTHGAGVVDRKVFFVKDGTAEGVGQGAQDVLLAITNITTELADPKCAVREATYWHGEFDSMMKALTPVIAISDDARADRQSLSPEVEAARQAWLSGYLVAKCVVEGVLRDLGRLEQMPIFFHDLRVPGNSKITEPPPDEPEAPATGEDEKDEG